MADNAAMELLGTIRVQVAARQVLPLCGQDRAGNMVEKEMGGQAMKVNLLIPIEVSEDGKKCGECPFLIGQQYRQNYCHLFSYTDGYPIKLDFDDKGNFLRFSACLAAEGKAKEEK